MKKNKIVFWIISIAISLILIDQISKVVIQYNYSEPIGNEIINITLVQNEGIAFGLNKGNIRNIILTILVLFIIINFVRKQRNKIDEKTGVAIGLILAGGVSNLIDRIFRGGVIDFINLKYFAIFNLADIYVFVGWILLIIYLIRFNKKL